LVAQYQGVVWHALVEVFFLDVDVPVEMDDADPLRRALPIPRMQGKTDRVVARRASRASALEENTWATPRGKIWSKLFSRLAGS